MFAARVRRTIWLERFPSEEPVGPREDIVNKLTLGVLGVAVLLTGSAGIAGVLGDRHPDARVVAVTGAGGAARAERVSAITGDGLRQPSTTESVVELDRI